MDVRDISVRQLQDSVETYRKLLQAAQARFEAAQDELVRLARWVCSGYLDNLQKTGKDLRDFAPKDLGDAIMGGLQQQVAPNGQDDLVREIERLKADLNAAQRRADEASGRIAELERQAQAYEQTLRQMPAKLQPAASTVEAKSDDDDKAWLGEWMKQRNKKHICELVEKIGSTGHSYISDILADIGSRPDDHTASVALYRNLAAGEKDGLIERRKAKASENGRPADAFVLTNRGQMLYRYLAGHDAAESDVERLLKEHKDDRHLALIRRTAELFSGLGFEVNTNPPEIRVGEGSAFKPDLSVFKAGETFYLEVETGREKDSLPQKWANAFTAGGGKICVVTPRTGEMNNMQSSLTTWARDCGRKPVIYMTNIEYLKAQRPGESPWARVRDMEKKP